MRRSPRLARLPHPQMITSDILFTLRNVITAVVASSIPHHSSIVSSDSGKAEGTENRSREFDHKALCYEPRDTEINSWVCTYHRRRPYPKHPHREEAPLVIRDHPNQHYPEEDSRIPSPRLIIRSILQAITDLLHIQRIAHRGELHPLESSAINIRCSFHNPKQRSLAHYTWKTRIAKPVRQIPHFLKKLNTLFAERRPLKQSLKLDYPTERRVRNLNFPNRRIHKWWRDWSLRILIPESWLTACQDSNQQINPERLAKSRGSG